MPLEFQLLNIAHGILFISMLMMLNLSTGRKLKQSSDVA